DDVADPDVAGDSRPGDDERHVQQLAIEVVTVAVKALLAGGAYVALLAMYAALLSQCVRMPHRH
ncbi:MAG TPA: hypothetical protein VFL79_10635, partial [Terriglobia bacterium]|nr:hypothetical protein [Terriglobia bacterium]